MHEQMYIQLAEIPTPTAAEFNTGMVKSYSGRGEWLGLLTSFGRRSWVNHRSTFFVNEKSHQEFKAFIVEAYLFP